MSKFQSTVTPTENVNALSLVASRLVTIPCLRTVSMVYRQRKETER